MDFGNKYWEISNLCNSYFNYRKNGGTKTFLEWYFTDDNSRIIKKIYFIENFSSYITLSELNTLASMYAEDRIINEEIAFHSWFEKNIFLLDRKNKINKIKSNIKKDNTL